MPSSKWVGQFYYAVHKEDQGRMNLLTLIVLHCTRIIKIKHGEFYKKNHNYRHLLSYARINKNNSTYIYI